MMKSRMTRVAARLIPSDLRFPALPDQQLQPSERNSAVALDSDERYSCLHVSGEIKVHCERSLCWLAIIVSNQNVLQHIYGSTSLSFH